VEKAVSQFAEDFGYDLDEEGQPTDEGDDGERKRHSDTQDDSKGASRDNGRGSEDSEDDGGREADEKKEREATPA